MTDSPEITCSFCGKPASEVERVLAGPGIAICDECVVLAVEISGEGRPEWCDRLIEKITVLRDKS